MNEKKSPLEEAEQRLAKACARLMVFESVIYLASTAILAWLVYGLEGAYGRST